MISSGLRLALAPVILLVVAAVVPAFPPQRERMARALAVLACGAALALLISDVGVVAAQGQVEAAFGIPVAGTAFLFRADSTGVALAVIAASAALFALLEPERSSRRSGAILLCAAGSWGAALAGNAVLLFAGLEAANVGAMLLMSRGRRPSRGVVASFAVQHLAALGLLGAAVELTLSTGTSDLAAIPVGAVSAAIALPWALAGATRLVAPALAPSGAGLAWAAVGAVPAGAAVLLRLRKLAGPLPLSVILILEIAGALVVVWGAMSAVRRASNPQAAGRGLLLIGAGLPLAVIGVTADSAGAAAAAALVALELSVAAAPLWSARFAASRARWPAAAALLLAGNLPVGFGMSAVVLVLGAAASPGLAGGALLPALGLGVALGVVASLRAVGALLRRPPDHAAHPIPPLAAVAVVLSLAAAFVPGAVAAGVLSALAPTTLPPSADAASLRGPQGGWASGYFFFAALWLSIVVVSAFTLLGRTLVKPPLTAQETMPEPAPAWVPLVRARRRIRRPLARVLAGAAGLDQWLVAQPRLPMVLIATLLAALFLH